MDIKLYLNYQEKHAITIPEKIVSDNEIIYEVGERLDSGGNAVVHQALNAMSGIQVAIKFLVKTSSQRRKRFLKEIRLLKEIQHYHIILYLDNGKVNGYFKQRDQKVPVTVPFLVMPLADRNLKQLISNDSGVLSYEQYIGQFKGLCSALGILHKKAIHRDIKPENVLIIGDTWVLSDFGLCRFHLNNVDCTSADEKIGPTYWLSPEAINRVIGNDDTISKESDVFQLCSVFWYVVTKRHPTGCLSSMDWNGSKELYEIIVSALSHDPARRPHDGVVLYNKFDNIFSTNIWPLRYNWAILFNGLYQRIVELHYAISGKLIHRHE